MCGPHFRSRPTAIAASLLIFGMLLSGQLSAKRPSGTDGELPKAEIEALNDVLQQMATALQLDKPAVLTEAYRPLYPVTRLREDITGQCTIRLGVDRFGKVMNPRRINPETEDDKMCDHAIIAVRQWVFEPAVDNGIAIDLPDIGSISFKYQIAD